MFRRRARKAAAPGVNAYQGLREQMLNLDPDDAGLGPTGPADRLWGCVMETGYPNGAATLVCLRDGTTSLYVSSGGGIIGGGAHESVALANAALLVELAGELDRLPVQEDQSLPASGRTVIRAMTYEGPRAYEASADDLGHGRDPLSSVFRAAHGVITELRLLEESGR